MYGPVLSGCTVQNHQLLILVVEVEEWAADRNRRKWHETGTQNAPLGMANSRFSALGIYGCFWFASRKTLYDVMKVTEELPESTLHAPP